MDSLNLPESSLGSPARWLEEHGDVLYRMALVRTGNPELSEDLVQETLLAAWQKRDQFAGRSTERAWLVAILKRKVIDHFRRSWRQVSLNDDDAEDVGSGDFVRDGEFAGRWKPDMAPSDWELDPERALQERQLGHALVHVTATGPASWFSCGHGEECEVGAIHMMFGSGARITDEITPDLSKQPESLAAARALGGKLRQRLATCA